MKTINITPYHPPKPAKRGRQKRMPVVLAPCQTTKVEVAGVAGMKRPSFTKAYGELEIDGSTIYRCPRCKTAIIVQVPAEVRCINCARIMEPIPKRK